MSFRWREVAPGVWRGGDGDANLEIELRGADWWMDSDASEDRWTAYFEWGIDHGARRDELLRRDPRLTPAIKAFPGLRLLRPQAPFDVIVGFLLSQNSNVARITQMHDALHELADGRFPRPEEVAKKGEDYWREKGLGYRAKYLAAASQQVQCWGGDQALQEMKALPYREVTARLVELAGVGPKVADCIALFGYHHGEAVPVDTHIWKSAIASEFAAFAGKSITASRYREIGDTYRRRFGDLAALAQQYDFTLSSQRGVNRG